MGPPKGSKECYLLLAKAANALQQGQIGNQSGGRVLLLYTNNFEQQHQNLLANQIKIEREPKLKAYAKSLLF